MQLTNEAAKKLVEITRQYNLQPKVAAAIRQTIMDDLKKQYWRESDNVEQILGKALGYPYYASDQKNFPGSTEVDGVCVGDHVPESIADEAVRHLERMAKALHWIITGSQAQPAQILPRATQGLGGFNGPAGK